MRMEKSTIDGRSTKDEREEYLSKQVTSTC